MELTHIIIILLHCFDLRLCPTNNGEIVEIILLLKIVQSGARNVWEIETISHYRVHVLNRFSIDINLFISSFASDLLGTLSSVNIEEVNSFHATWTGASIQ